jgi:hypothetical protein
MFGIPGPGVTQHAFLLLSSLLSSSTPLTLTTAPARLDDEDGRADWIVEAVAAPRAAARLAGAIVIRDS